MPYTARPRGVLPAFAGLALAVALAACSAVSPPPTASVVDTSRAPSSTPAPSTISTSTTASSSAPVSSTSTSTSSAPSTTAPTATTAQLPGGGTTLFPGHALVALYGHPGGGSLGVLGEQGPDAAVARAKQVAAPYRSLYTVPVVPTFEIIATVAAGSAGADGDYSNESSVAQLQPMVDAATRAGMYVVLDLQPGRADLVRQASIYTSLLEQPNVGLALDPEWALTSRQLPLHQIGSLSAAQIDRVVNWLADLTAAHHLPQKVLVLHQFRASMITDEVHLDTSRKEVQLLVHADGQGARALKEGTWARIVAGAPKGVYFGWKNFYDEDPQPASPADTVHRTPVPLMVSYQ